MLPLFIIATLCLIPGSLLGDRRRMLFGPLTGSLLSFAAATLASSLSFLIARWLDAICCSAMSAIPPSFRRLSAVSPTAAAISWIPHPPGAALPPTIFRITLYWPDGDPLRPFTLISAVTTPAGSGHLFGDGQRTGPRGVTLAFALQTEPRRRAAVCPGADR